MSNRNKSKSRLEIWIPIIVALIGLIGVVANALITTRTGTPEDKPQDETIDYQVRVVDSATGEVIEGAEVMIETGSLAPVDAYSDTRGIARIFLESSRVGKPGRLIVKANGYETYLENMDIASDTLPDTIKLEANP